MSILALPTTFYNKAVCPPPSLRRCGRLVPLGSSVLAAVSIRSAAAASSSPTFTLRNNNSSSSSSSSRPARQGQSAFHRRAYTTMAANGSNEHDGFRLKNPTIFICDMQEKFQTAIHEFDKIVLTTKKLLTFANGFSIPVHTTTQTVAKLGPTVPSLAALLPCPPHDKTRFSMYIPAIVDQLPPRSAVALVGIESHICISQTALDLRDNGHRVYVLADAVSSCNPAEVAVALARLRAEPGITVTTSESWMYETVGDASHPGFKTLFGVVKNSLADTKTALSSLPPKI